MIRESIDPFTVLEFASRPVSILEFPSKIEQRKGCSTCINQILLAKEPNSTCNKTIILFCRILIYHDNYTLHHYIFWQYQPWHCQHLAELHSQRSPCSRSLLSSSRRLPPHVLKSSEGEGESRRREEQRKSVRRASE